MSIPAGWYPDETNPGTDRFWDGSWWTAQTRESASTSVTPPRPPAHPPQPSANDVIDHGSLEEEPRLLEISQEAFLAKTSDLSNRVKTYPAILDLWKAEKETYRRSREILDAHEQGLGRSVIRPLIQESVAWQKQHTVSTFETLQTAMNEDFEEMLSKVGGVNMLPISIEDAWENYVAPVKSLISDIQSESVPMLKAVAEVENQYLFA